MKNIEFSKEEKNRMIQNIRQYFEEELNQEIGQFDAEFLLDFFAETIGVYFYNQGLRDAQMVLKDRLDSIADAIYDIEKPTEFSR